jgi:hypothetical protein
VIHEGSAIPWILGADAVVHNSCTTGVEGFLLDRPTVAYVPVRSKTYDSLLPNSVSRLANTPQELIEFVVEAARHRGRVSRGKYRQSSNGFSSAMSLARKNCCPAIALSRFSPIFLPSARHP